MKNRLLLFACFATASAFAQQDPQFTHNAFDRLSVNPAAAGLGHQFCATLITRQQWVGLEGHPETTLFNFTGRVIDKGAAGLSFFQDRLGQEKTSLIRLSWAQHIDLNNGAKLSAGISAGLAHKSLKANWNATDGYINDVAINDVPVSEGKYDMSIGLFYSGNNIWGGISSTHLTEGKLATLNMDLSRHYYLMAGYDYNVSTWVISPSIFAKTDAASMQLDLNVRATWNNKMWGGITYRPGDAIAPMIGYQHPTTNGIFHMGYAYDVTTSQLSTVSSGSHEIMVSYCWNIPIRRTIYRDTRFMGTSKYDQGSGLPENRQ